MGFAARSICLKVKASLHFYTTGRDCSVFLSDSMVASFKVFYRCMGNFTPMMLSLVGRQACRQILTKLTMLCSISEEYSPCSDFWFCNRASTSKFPFGFLFALYAAQSTFPNSVLDLHVLLSDADFNFAINPKLLSHSKTFLFCGSGRYFVLFPTLWIEIVSDKMILFR